MKIGIDAYCYHRFPGGAYPELEQDPGFRLSVFDILDRASALDVAGVSFAFWPSVPLGRGLIDLPVILRLLRDAGFDELLALEIDYLSPLYENEDAAIAESVGFLRNQVASLGSKRPVDIATMEGQA